jgi:hypothetical protein
LAFPTSACIRASPRDSVYLSVKSDFPSEMEKMRPTGSLNRFLFLPPRYPGYLALQLQRAATARHPERPELPRVSLPSPPVPRTIYLSRLPNPLSSTPIPCGMAAGMRRRWPVPRSASGGRSRDAERSRHRATPWLPGQPAVRVHRSLA